MKTYKKPILGFDEVGRGCLAGPVVVACVLGNDDVYSLKSEKIVIRDSKKMSRNQREFASAWICGNFCYGLGLASAFEIDNIGIIRSILLAAARAFEELKRSHTSKYIEYTIINDGNQSWFSNAQAVIRADSVIKEVSMASIIAKVYRDNLMRKLEKKYPDWGFETHVGYGTAKHREMLEQFGLLENIHRKSFCSNITLP